MLNYYRYDEVLSMLNKLILDPELAEYSDLLLLTRAMVKEFRRVESPEGGQRSSL